MNNGTLRLWEVWHARFNFEEGAGYKYRPVIVVGTHPDGSLVMMVTSVGNKLQLPHDYVLQDWQQAGLDEPSIARADRVASLPPGYIGTAGRIGRLSQRDASALAAILETMVREAHSGE